MILPFVVLCMLMLILASTSPVPVAAGDPTLDAAMLVIIRATREEQDRRNAIAATRAAVEAEAAQQRAYAQATAQAISAESTRAALESTRSAVATRQSIDSAATRAAVESTATQQAAHMAATARAISAASTAQSISAAATATAIQDAQVARTNSERIRLSSLVALIVLGVAIGTASFRALWRISPRAAAKPVVVVVPDIVDVCKSSAPEEDELPPSPPTRVVYDEAEAQRITDALNYQDVTP